MCYANFLGATNSGEAEPHVEHKRKKAVIFVRLSPWMPPRVASHIPRNVHWLLQKIFIFLWKIFEFYPIAMPYEYLKWMLERVESAR